MGNVGAPWLVFLIAATWRYENDPKNRATLPPPRIYVGSAVLFTLLGLLAESDKAKGLAATFGWALVIAELIGGRLAPSNLTAGQKQTQTETAPGRTRDK